MKVGAENERKKELNHAREYWNDKLSEDMVPSSLLQKSSTSFVSGNRKEIIHSVLNSDISDKLNLYSNHSDYGLYMLLLSGVEILIYRYVGKEDTITGMPLFGEKISRLDNSKVLAVKDCVRGETPFKQVLNNIKQTLKEANHYKEITYDKILSLFDSKEKEQRNLKIITALRNIHKIDSYEGMDSEINFIFQKNEDGTINMDIEYDGSRLEYHVAVGIKDHLIRIYHSIVRNPNCEVSHIEMLSEDEKNHILYDFNNNAQEYNDSTTINQLFDKQVLKYGDRPAVSFRGNELTYNELNLESNHIAMVLREMGVKEGDIVGIMLECSLSMISGIMGILKAGGAYMPINPQNPTARTERMLQNSHVNILLSRALLCERLNFHGRIIDVTELSEYDYENCHDIAPINNAESLAYVIYTSGTTGEPKGTMITHKSVLNLAKGLEQRIDAMHEGRKNVALVASYVFDASVQQIFPTLLSGNKLCIVPEEVKVDGYKLTKFYIDNSIDISDGAPVHLNMLLSVPQKEIDKINVEHFIIGGDILQTKVVKQFFELFKNNNTHITNVYGPAECCVDSVLYTVDPMKMADDESIPIGSPMVNVEVYILDRDRNLVPVGVIGEIYISGAGLGKGYINNYCLTKERFLDNVFRNKAKMYRTGDLGLWKEDGTIQFIGRRDTQVKLRGFRIELGEIENKLINYKKERKLHQILKENKLSFVEPEDTIYCKKCLISSNHPNISFDEEGICNICNEFDQYSEQANAYFSNEEELTNLIEQAKTENPERKYDCILLYSGGKDSTYVLYKLLEQKLNVLAITFDNEYISETAFENIKNITRELNVDSMICSAKNMNQIFAESLKKDDTVCIGCFQALTTISTKIAEKRGINVIFTGLSRGQIFDTKLKYLFEQKIFDIDEIEQNMIRFRQIYHSKEDSIAKLLDVRLDNKSTFESIHFIDFFRYHQASSIEILNYLKSKSEYWNTPKDTGFCSTNCMVNDVGIYMHLKNRGYHNYAEPLSWDCRLNNLKREDGLREITTEFNVDALEDMLQKIGIEDRVTEDKYPIKEAFVAVKKNKNEDKFLCAYLVMDENLTGSEIREYLSKELPEYMIPSKFMGTLTIPMTPNGKLDVRQLETISEELGVNVRYVEPRDELEKTLADIWSEILEIDNIGIDDNFFELGGHSLNATNLLNRLYKEFSVEIPISVAFKNATIRLLAEHIKRAEKKKISEIEPVCIKPYYPITSAQNRVLLSSELQADSCHYNECYTVRIRGRIDKEQVKTAFEGLIKRHESLRTTFEIRNGEFVQIVQEHCQAFIHHMVSNPSEVEKVIQDFIVPFSMDIPPLMKIMLVELSETEYIMVWQLHHVITDGISLEILLKDFSDLYNQKKLTPLKLQYKDFAVWQNEFSYSRAMKMQENYWLNLYSDEIPSLDLMTDYKRPSVKSFEGEKINLDIGNELAEKIRHTALKENTTVFHVLLAIYNLMLHKYTGQEDIIVGIPMSGRNHPSVDNIVGMFVNTIALRSHPRGNIRFNVFLKEVKEQMIEAYENQDYQFERLVEKLGISYGRSDNPMFNTMFALQKDTIEWMDLDGCKAEHFPIIERTSKMDLTCMITESEHEINVSFEYSTKLYQKETMERMLKHYVNLIATIPDQIDARLNEIDMLSEEEKERLLNDCHKTEDYPREKTVSLLFEEQTQKTPNNIALVFEKEKRTYAELSANVNRIARYLRKRGIRPNSIVPILMERSIELIEGILGILKAGGAYLPIDMSYPKERINYVLKDCGSKVLLTTGLLEEGIEFDGQAIDIHNKEIAQESAGALEVLNHPNDLVYIIYTSGTTGNPKGTLVKHHGFTNLVWWYTNEFNFTEEDNVLLMASIGFDLAQKNVYAPLLTGGTLVLANKGMLSYERVNQIIEECRITIINCAPSMFYPLIDLNKESDYKKLCSLRYVFLGGETINLKYLRPWLDSNSCELINTYGPTECTDVVSFYRVKKEDRLAPIGKGINNTKLFILDRNKKLLPVGVKGELYISGEGVGKGYLNKPELNSEKFSDNPFEMGSKLYQTGDLVRMLPDGNIEFIGREDNQVKIRGYRIELGEIEEQLVTHERVKNSVVMAKEGDNGDRYLCAYVAKEGDVTIHELKKYLLDRLPAYMVPSFFTLFDELPQTANGKIDKRALLKQEDSVEIRSDYVAPKTATETRLIGICKEILKIDSISMTDSFFYLGGESLKVMNLIARVDKEMDIKLSFRKIFSADSIKSIADFIESEKKGVYDEIVPVRIQEHYSVSSSQARMYVLNYMVANNLSYNVSLCLKADGLIDKEKIENIFNQLVNRHEALRTSFHIKDDKLVQIINADVSFHISYMEASEQELNAQIKQFIQPFDLSKAPLLRVALIKISREQHIIVFDTHHIISDGVSMAIIAREFIQLLKGKELLELKLQYKDFAEWHNNFLKTDTIKNQEEYWLSKLSGDLPTLELPKDYYNIKNVSIGHNYYFAIDEMLSNEMKRVAVETKSTIYMVLLAAYYVFLNKLTSQEDIIIGLPVAGRTHADLENIVGVFINTIVLRNYPKRDKTWKEFLTEVKDTTLDAFEHQEYPFEEIVDKLRSGNKSKRSTIFETMFVFENVEYPKLETENLVLEPFEFSGEHASAKFDLMLGAEEHKGVLTFNFEYNTGIFREDTIREFSHKFINVLELIAENVDTKIEDF